MTKDKQSTNNLSSDERARLRELVREVDFCMLTTIDEHGDPHSRPMSTNGEIDQNGDLWFFTYGDSHKAHEVERRSKVNASFADPNKQIWISMTGTAEVIRDRGKMEELWQPQLKAWFPRGLDEPDIALLKVNVEKAEYWDSPSSIVAHVYSLASALVTGKPASPGENKEVDLRSGRVRQGSAARRQEERGSGGRNANGESDTSRSGVGSGSLRTGRGGQGISGESGVTSSGLALIGGAALGAALMYLLDPERGRTRRAYLTDKATRLSTDAGRQITAKARDLSNRAQGVVAEARSTLASDSSETSTK